MLTHVPDILPLAHRTKSFNKCNRETKTVRKDVADSDTGSVCGIFTFFMIAVCHEIVY